MSWGVRPSCQSLIPLHRISWRVRPSCQSLSPLLCCFPLPLLWSVMRTGGLCNQARTSELGSHRFFLTFHCCSNSLSGQPQTLQGQSIGVTQGTQQEVLDDECMQDAIDEALVSKLACHRPRLTQLLSRVQPTISWNRVRKRIVLLLSPSHRPCMSSFTTLTSQLWPRQLRCTRP